MPLGYFTDSTPLTPLRDPFNVLVDAVNANETAITDLGQSRAIQTFRWADASERSSQTGMVAGDAGYQTDMGMDYIYTGSAWRMNTGGLIHLNSHTFSSASSVVADDFSNAFPGYRLRLRAEFSTTATATGVLRSSGSDLTGANYDRQQLWGSTATPGAVGAVGETSFLNLSFTNRNRAAVDIELFSVREASPTILQATITPHGGGTLLSGVYGGVYTQNTVIDGMKFVTTAGTMTGTLDVYGYVR